ncbi:hypothetical protein SCUCBS95973_009171 [Sporothrix curviconia]|uniref:Uncharacterized protein n=1 Tax=Sporothrix curviconia TaxID=1260050 RepID=A0ABP0CSZ7_9PEZI
MEVGNFIFLAAYMFCFVVVLLLQPLDRPWLPKPFQAGGRFRKFAPLAQGRIHNYKHKVSQNNGQAIPNNSEDLEMGGNMMDDEVRSIDTVVSVGGFPPMYDQMDFKVDVNVSATASSSKSGTPSNMAFSDCTTTASSTAPSSVATPGPATIRALPRKPAPVELSVKVSVSVAMALNNGAPEPISSEDAKNKSEGKGKATKLTIVKSDAM